VWVICPGQPLRVLISGASVAGPTAAYWLCRQGFAVTVVERMPLTRVRTSGHAVDLFGPAMDVAEWAGVLPAVMDARTRTEIVSFQRQDGRGVDVEMRRLVAGISGRHVEVMRGELAAILYEATRSDAQYLFEDSIHTIVEEADGIAVTFEHAPANRFDLVIGADGLHSIVRRLVFGPEDQFRRFLGGYLAGAALPNYLGLDGRMVVWNAQGSKRTVYGRLARSDAERLADAAVVCRSGSGRPMSEVSRRRRSSRARFDAAGNQGPALESPWEFFLAASLVPGRVLTLPAWRKWKQRLPGSHMPQLPGRGLRRGPPPLPARPQERRTPPGRAVHVRQHSPRKRPGAHHACSPRRGSETTDVDRVAGASVPRLLLVEKVQDVFRAEGGPLRKQPVVLVCQCFAAAHGDQSGVTLGWQDWHEFVLSRHPARSPRPVPTTHRRQRRDRPSGVNELDGRAFLKWPAACTPGTEFRADR
jgi:2-polyprenyl-6-methoxyphenol hydroxylase-like FAD-dependent oxidoreductase